MSDLSSKDKATLRGYAQKLKPSAFVGRKGVNEGLVRELKLAFKTEDLVKVAFKADRDDIAVMVREIEIATGSQCVGGVGKRRSFYREQDG